MTNSGGERPIDRLRSAAISMKVGMSEDGGVQTMVPMEDALYGVHAHAIYAIRLADQIDPGRTNAAVPNTHQRLLAMGAQDPEVGRIFLTAHSFFKSMHLGDQFPEKKAVSLAFEYLQDIAAIMDLRRKLEIAVQDAVRRHEDIPKQERNVGLPALGDAAARCDAFAQKVGHAVDTLKAIARLFYPEELKRKWIDSLTELAAKKYGEEAFLTKFMREARPTLLFLRELRNMVEHPSDTARIEVHDFRLLPSMELITPSLEIIRAGHDTASNLRLPIRDLRCFGGADDSSVCVDNYGRHLPGAEEARQDRFPWAELAVLVQCPTCPPSRCWTSATSSANRRS